MIKPNELRIGNLIDSYHGIVPVTGIKDGIIYHEPNAIGATHGGILSLVPLTEDWLKRFAKEAVSTLNGKVCNRRIEYHLNDRYEIVNSNKDEWLVADWVHDGAYISTIKYVHQLQNLYFALTGEELKLKNNG